MTLGGLALAVGILVDDATVTIENINYHLEQGKPVEAAIMDGANQIVTPAFVSLLCICIVFVPMFFLTGVARFLFVPMAEAVMFAMAVVVHPVAHAGADDGELSAAAACASRRRRAPPPSRNPLVAFPARLRGGVRARLRKAYRDLLSMAIGASCRSSCSASSDLSRLRSCWCRSSAATSFPRSTPAMILMHVRTQIGTRVEESANQFADVQKAIRKIIPPNRNRHARRQHRHADQRHQHDLQQHRRDRPAGRRRPDQAERGSSADGRTTCRPCASNCRALFRD